MNRCPSHLLWRACCVFLRSAACGVVLVAHGSCCSDEPTVPCTTWLREGETYRAELVGHFDIENDDDPDLEYPYPGYQRHEETCGDALDLDVGSIVSLTAREKTKRNQPESCDGGCFHRRATAQIAGVVVERDEPRLPHPVGSEEFYARFVASIGDQCRVVYDVGLARIEPIFIQESSQPIPTDYMLFRSVIVAPDFDGACRAFVAMSERNLCWDSWFVRVRDSTGELISRDLASSRSHDAGP